MASDAKTGSARTFGRRACAACSVRSGGPKIRRRNRWVEAPRSADGTAWGSTGEEGTDEEGTDMAAPLWLGQPQSQWKSRDPKSTSNISSTRRYDGITSA